MKKKPAPLWKNPKWQYVPAAQTDILKRFKQAGWVPPSEQKL